MSNEIQITVSGRAGSVPVLSQNGKAYARFRLASNRRTRNPQGEWVDEATQWFTVKCWGDTAHNVMASIRTGTPVLVQGLLIPDHYVTAGGVEMTGQEIRANAVGVELSHGIATYGKVTREKDGSVATGELETAMPDGGQGGAGGRPEAAAVAASEGAGDDPPF